MNQKQVCTLSEDCIYLFIYSLFVCFLAVQPCTPAQCPEGSSEQAGESHGSRPVAILPCVLLTLHVSVPRCSPDLRAAPSLLLGGESKCVWKALTSAVTVSALLDELTSRQDSSFLWSAIISQPPLLTLGELLMLLFGLEKRLVSQIGVFCKAEREGQTTLSKAAVKAASACIGQKTNVLDGFSVTYFHFYVFTE